MSAGRRAAECVSSWDCGSSNQDVPSRDGSPLCPAKRRARLARHCGEGYALLQRRRLPHGGYGGPARHHRADTSSRGRHLELPAGSAALPRKQLAQVGYARTGQPEGKPDRRGQLRSGAQLFPQGSLASIALANLRCPADQTSRAAWPPRPHQGTGFCLQEGLGT